MTDVDPKAIEQMMHEHMTRLFNDPDNYRFIPLEWTDNFAQLLALTMVHYRNNGRQLTEADMAEALQPLRQGYTEAVGNYLMQKHGEQVEIKGLVLIELFIKCLQLATDELEQFDLENIPTVKTPPTLLDIPDASAED